MAKKKNKKSVRKVSPKRKSIKKKKVIKRGSSRFRSIQKYLSQYTKANGLKLGRGFNKAAGELHRKTTGSPLKYVDQNIDQLYKELIPSTGPITISFPDNFPYYNFLSVLDEPTFDNVTVSLTMKDNYLDVDSGDGTASDIRIFFKNTLYKHCRQYYDKSPVAIVRIVDTDNKTFIDYEIVPGEEMLEEEEGVAIGEEKEAIDKMKSEVKKDKEEEVQGVEAIKEKTKLAEIELEIEKQKLEVEKIKNKNLILELFSKGLITKEEMLKLLNG